MAVTLFGLEFADEEDRDRAVRDLKHALDRVAEAEAKAEAEARRVLRQVVSVQGSPRVATANYTSGPTGEAAIKLLAYDQRTMNVVREIRETLKPWGDDDRAQIIRAVLDRWDV